MNLNPLRASLKLAQDLTVQLTPSERLTKDNIDAIAEHINSCVRLVRPLVEQPKPPDFLSRLEKAHEELVTLSTSVTGPERGRLLAKASGISYALTVVKEYNE